MKKAVAATALVVVWKDRARIMEWAFYPREGHGIAEYYHQKNRLTRSDWVTRHTLGSGKTTSQ